jgi:ABC-type branched-subunit amino acid transport system ATPase component/ABC-type branched-subunit amino acid transport system permease subunit
MLPLVRHGALAVIVLAVLGPAWLGSPFAVHMAILALVYGLLAVALSLYVAAGLLDLGFIAFFAIGAFGTVIALRLDTFEVPVLLCVFAGNGLLAAFLAVAAGRSRGDYFAVVTLAFGEMVRIVIRNESALTGGPQGLSLPAGQRLAAWMAADSRRALIVIGALALAGAGLAQAVLRSSVGYRALFCREQEAYFRASGLAPLAVRLKMALLGSLLATGTGVFFGVWQGYVSPSSFSFFESLTVLVIVVLGSGIRVYVPGVLLAAGLVVVVPEILKSLGEYRMLVFGVLVVAVTLLLPSGLLGLEWPRWENRAVWRQLHRLPAGAGAAPGTEARSPNAARDLAVADLTAGYPTSEAPVLRDFSYTFQAGRIYSLIGYNGSGKTTLLRAMLSFPDLDLLAGQVQVGNRVVRSAADGREVASPLLGACLQRLSLVPYLSMFQHAMAIVGDSAERVRPRCAKLGARLQLDWDRLLLPVSALGPFDRRLGELLLALLRDPAVLLLDEPMAGLNDDEAERYYGAVRSLAIGKVVIFIEHAQRIVRRHADVVLFISRGSLATAEAPREGSSLVPDPRTGALLAAGTYEDVMALDIAREYLGGHSPRPLPRAEGPATGGGAALRAHVGAAGYPGAPSVLRQVDIAAAPGDILVLTGLNGAGKSTLLRVLARRPEVTVADCRISWRPGEHEEVDLRQRPPHALAALGFAMVLEGAKIFPSLRVAENLGLGGSNRGRAAGGLALELFRGPLAATFFGPGNEPNDAQIEAVLRQPGEALSGGQQQALAVMRAILEAARHLALPARRAIMLLDEPSAGIQQGTVRGVYQVLANLHAGAPDRFLLIAAEQSLLFAEILTGAATAVLCAGEPLSIPGRRA